MDNVTAMPFNFKVLADAVQKHNLTLFRAVTQQTTISSPDTQKTGRLSDSSHSSCESLLVRVWLL
jgi:hypothetical protein